MSGHTGEESGGIQDRDACGEGARGGGRLGSVQKPQKATKSGHGQVTSHLPSSP